MESTNRKTHTQTHTHIHVHTKLIISTSLGSFLHISYPRTVNTIELCGYIKANENLWTKHSQSADVHINSNVGWLWFSRKIHMINVRFICTGSRLRNGWNEYGTKAFSLDWLSEWFLVVIMFTRPMWSGKNNNVDSNRNCIISFRRTQIDHILSKRFESHESDTFFTSSIIQSSIHKP